MSDVLDRPPPSEVAFGGKLPQWEVVFYKPAGMTPIPCEIKILSTAFNMKEGAAYNHLIPASMFGQRVIMVGDELSAKGFAKIANKKVVAHQAHNPNLGEHRFEARLQPRVN